AVLAVIAGVLEEHQVAGAGQVARHSTTSGEVPGRHVFETRLVAGTEGPVNLLFCLPMQTVHIFDATGALTEGRTSNQPRSERAVVTSNGNFTGACACNTKDRVAEPGEHAECEGHMALIWPQGAAVQEVGGAFASNA